MLQARETLPLSRTLVTLKRDADVPFALETARVRPLPAEQVFSLFDELGFNRFREEVRRLSQGRPDAANGSSLPVAGVPVAVTGPVEHRAITTLAELEALAAALAPSRC